MKKFFVVLVALVVTASIAHAQLNFGVRAGFNLTNMATKFDGKSENDDVKFKPGFQIGAVVDYALTDAISLQPGILFAQQGSKYEKDKYKEVTNLNYIQVPINVQYKLDLGGMNLILQAGPYIGFGLGGKEKVTVDGKKVSDKEYEEETGRKPDISFGSGKDDHLSAFDFGIGLGAGLQFGAIQAGVGYNLGLANIAHKDAEKTTIKNSGIAITLTYVFGY